ncbi:hypothetical protein ANCDUO_16966 [Ancylostoma duodenale]|uniref:Uncharacterized protein n=1 Tax=Ancylostoma duodenale TaxID=51022 RepID=A0A0C2C9G0_9BILA|nr:hypothetical protein ANCDUO_16966 [Ancylostoma duodenale]
MVRIKELLLKKKLQYDTRSSRKCRSGRVRVRMAGYPCLKIVAKVLDKAPSPREGKNWHVKYLLMGMNIHDRDYDDRTALHVAASEGQLECLNYVLSKWKESPGDIFFMGTGKGNEM